MEDITVHKENSEGPGKGDVKTEQEIDISLKRNKKSTSINDFDSLGINYKKVTTTYPKHDTRLAKITDIVTKDFRFPTQEVESQSLVFKLDKEKCSFIVTEVNSKQFQSIKFPPETTTYILSPEQAEQKLKQYIDSSELSNDPKAKQILNIFDGYVCEEKRQKDVQNPKTEPKKTAASVKPNENSRTENHSELSSCDKLTKDWKIFENQVNKFESGGITLDSIEILRKNFNIGHEQKIKPPTEYISGKKLQHINGKNLHV